MDIAHMMVVLDVHYGSSMACGAAVGFSDWQASEPAFETAVVVRGVERYEPGAFFRRELPVLRAVLATLPAPPELVVVDGYVWLGPERPGLGWYLHDSLQGRVPVVGVAKNAFARGAHAQAVLRGQSSRPLFVTSVGLDPEPAAQAVRGMAGSYRIPTLLKRVDALAREGLPAEPASDG